MLHYYRYEFVQQDSVEPRSNLICKSFRKSEHKLEGNSHIISVNNVVVNERNTNLTSAIAQVGIKDK